MNFGYALGNFCAFISHSRDWRRINTDALLTARHEPVYSEESEARLTCLATISYSPFYVPPHQRDGLYYFRIL